MFLHAAQKTEQNTGQLRLLRSRQPTTNNQHSNEADQSSDIGVFSLVLSPIMPTLTDCSLELLLSCGARLEVLSIIVRINTQMDPRHK